MKRTRASVVLGLAVWGLVAAPGCKSKLDCDIAKVADVSSGRATVIRPTLMLVRKDGEWRPERLVRTRAFEDRGRHRVASGTVEVYGDGAAPVATAQSDGPAILEAEALRSVGGSAAAGVDSMVLGLAVDQALEGARFALRLPDERDGARTASPVKRVRWIPRSELASAPSVAAAGASPTLDFDLAEVPVEEASPVRDAPPRYRTPEGVTSDLPVETILWSGPPRDRLNLVVLADGFTADQMGLYRSEAAEMVADLMTHEPYKGYAGLINVFRVDVPSEEEGADCDDQKYSPRKNRYGSSFPVACINALVGTKFNDRFVHQLNAPRVLGDAAHLEWDGVSIADETYVLVHSPKYGGSAIIWANQTDRTSWVTMSHELGHSWGGLADTYLVPGDLCQIWMAFKPNLSIKKTKRERVKWAQWIEKGTPLPTPDTGEYGSTVGLFQGGGQGCVKSLYRPARECKMRSSSRPFCPVCMEQMIHRLYDRAALIQGPLAREGSMVDAPVALPDRVLARWYVDGKIAQETEGYSPLQGLEGAGRDVRLVVFDASAPVRKDRCDLVFSARAKL